MQHSEKEKHFEYESRKDRASDPLEPMINDEDGEDDMEYGRR